MAPHTRFLTVPSVLDCSDSALGCARSSNGCVMPKAAPRTNGAKSKIRSRGTHLRRAWGARRRLFVHRIRVARASVKIGFLNLVPLLRQRRAARLPQTLRRRVIDRPTSEHAPPSRDVFAAPEIPRHNRVEASRCRKSGVMRSAHAHSGGRGASETGGGDGVIPVFLISYGSLTLHHVIL
jgi:hypothetical protein